MVDEESLISAIRRMIRTSHKYVVIQVTLTAFADIRSNRELVQFLHVALNDLAKADSGQCFVMTNGDLFLQFRADRIHSAEDVVDRVVALVFADRASKTEDRTNLAVIYQVPADYATLRRRSNEYLVQATAPDQLAPELSYGPIAEAAEGAAGAAENIAKDLRGPLSATMLSQMQRAIAVSDVSSLVRFQTACETDHNGNWWPVFQEHYISIPELQKAKFPNVSVTSTDRLFNEIGRVLDAKVLKDIQRRHASVLASRISLNLTVDTIVSPLFDEFIRELSAAERPNVIFEVAVADLFQDFTAGLAAFKRIRAAGCGLALDSATIDLLPYVNFARLDHDYLKVPLLKQHLPLLRQPEGIEAMKQLDRRKIVLCRCDQDTALHVGQAFGVTKFQGWLIDQQVNPAMQKSAGS